MISRLIKKNPQIIYVFVWIVVSAIHYFILRRIYSFPVATSLADSLVFNLLFALIGSGLWFMVRYSDLQKKSASELAFNHLTGAALSILIWISLSKFILRLLFKDESLYMDFLNNSTTIRIISGVLYYSVLIMIYYLVINFRELKEKVEREQKLTDLLKEAELDMLKSQIRPHFLFNSLNSISSLTMSDPERAQEMVIKLSEFMRYSLNLSGLALSSLEKELYHANLYLDIEKVRFGKKLKVKEDIDEDSLAHEVPAMILQPLMENAVKFGVYEAGGASEIEIRAKIEQGMLNIHIGNSFDPDGKVRKGTGTGIKNVKARLQNLYGRHDLLTINKTENYFNIDLRIPEHVENKDPDRR